MTVEVMLIFLSLTVILAYLLDIISSRTKIPPVMWMLMAGLSLRLVADQVGFHLPHIGTVLPLLGTIGLILIVLDAGLDLDIALEKLPLIRKGFGVAFVGMMLVALFLTSFFHIFLEVFP